MISTSPAKLQMPLWGWLLPVLAAVVFAVSFVLPDHPLVGAALFGALICAVIAGVFHAEVVAHKVGEPFGTLVLALAITIIEVSLIISLMFAGGPAAEDLVRNTLFAVIMIICNGVVGLCVVVGAVRYGEQGFRIQGAFAAFTVLIALSTLTLVLPLFTTSTPGPTYSMPQLIFAGVASLTLYAVFVFVQTVKHRDYFLPTEAASLDEHAPPPSKAAAWSSFGLLFVCLVCVVGLAKRLAPSIERAVEGMGAPHTVVGITIALLVLMPETWAAVRAARTNRFQTSLNLALGSALASIGLTIPAVVAVAVVFDLPMVLGLNAKELVLLTLTFLTGTLTLGTGRTNVLQGSVQLMIFVAFLFLSLFP